MGKVSPLVLLPPIIFVVVAGLFLWGMFFGQGRDLPSTLIGQPHPMLPEETLPGKRSAAQLDLSDGEVTVVNFWASWCPPCRAEHPTLLALKAEGVRLVGVNFRDQQGAALDYLAEETDPFTAHGFDPRGRTAIDWGVSAPPETFILSGDGTVLFRFAGPLVGSDYEQRFRPALDSALAEN